MSWHKSVSYVLAYSPTLTLSPDADGGEGISRSGEGISRAPSLLFTAIRSLHSQRSVFRSFPVWGHLDELRIELAQDRNQVALRGHDLADVFILHRHLIPP